MFGILSVFGIQSKQLASTTINIKLMGTFAMQGLTDFSHDEYILWGGTQSALRIVLQEYEVRDAIESSSTVGITKINTYYHGLDLRSRTFSSKEIDFESFIGDFYPNYKSTYIPYCAPMTNRTANVQYIINTSSTAQITESVTIPINRMGYYGCILSVDVKYIRSQAVPSVKKIIYQNFRSLIYRGCYVFSEMKAAEYLVFIIALCTIRNIFNVRDIRGMEIFPTPWFGI